MINTAIKETATSTYGLLYKFVDHPEIDIILQKLDIKATLQTVKSIMHNIQIEQISEPVYISLQQLHQIMCHIADDLIKVRKMVIQYKKKWFHSWRIAEYKPYLESLKINNSILDKRLANLYKLLEINNNFQSIIEKKRNIYNSGSSNSYNNNLESHNTSHNTSNETIEYYLTNEEFIAKHNLSNDWELIGDVIDCDNIN